MPTLLARSPEDRHHLILSVSQLAVVGKRYHKFWFLHLHCLNKMKSFLSCCQVFCPQAQIQLLWLRDKILEIAPQSAVDIHEVAFLIDVHHRLASLNRLAQSIHHVVRIVEGKILHAASRALIAGVERREEEISVRHSVPAPVEMVVAIATVSVAHKLMSLVALSVSRIEDGTVFRQVIIHQAVPFLVGIQIAALNVRALVVAEVLHHAERNIVGCSATAAWLEFHIHGIRHVAHQQRHCIPLRLVACYHLALSVGVGVKHVVPVEVVVAHVYVVNFTNVVGGMADTLSLHWPLMVVSHLRHCRCHTARGAVA